MPVLASVRGRVVKVVADVEENPAGRVDGERNWGNLVLLEDPRGFCVELSHFAHRTIRVQEGQWVERGAMLGLCGNSGYSAQPHIHVQVQADARIGAPTLPFSFVSYRCGDVYHANDLPREADDVEPLCVDPQLDAAATFLPDGIQQFEILRGGQPAGKVAFRTALAADGTHYFQAEKGWLSFGKYEGTFYCFRLEGDDPWLRMIMTALPRLPLCFKQRLAWKDSITAGMACTGVPRFLARLGSLVWPRLAHVDITQRFIDRYCVESSLEHPLLRAKRKARVEMDLRGGFASIQVGDLELKRLRAEGDAPAPLSSQPRSQKRRRLMSVTAIACLATLAALYGADGTTSSTTAAPSAESPVRSVLKRSVQAERAWDYATGIAALKEQYDAHSGHYGLNLRLGWLNYLSGQNDEALRCYKAAVEAAPKSIEAKLGYLLPLLAAAKYAEAEAVARQIVAADPQNYYGNLRLAVALRMQRKTDDARAIVKRMLAAYPTDGSYLNESATLGEGQSSIYLVTDAKIMAALNVSSQAEARGDYPAAIKALADQQAANPKDYLLNLRLGWLHYLNRDYAMSVESYDAAVQAAAPSLEAKLGASLSALTAEKYEAVESQLKTLLKQDPLNYYGNLRLAVALRLEKKYAAAVAVVQPLLAAYPTDVTWLNERGLLELAQGKKELAKETFADVLALDPENYTANQALQGL
jgi:tetratricopeptide (TPR) repeat protein